MPRMPNAVTIDATSITTDGLLVPRDIDNTDVSTVPDGYDFGAIDAYDMPNASVKADWAVKVVNDSDASVDAEVAVTTSDDEALEEYDVADSATAATGDPPDNVELVHGSVTVGHLGVVLSADPAPTTGTVKVVFNSRLYGGA